MCKKPNHTKKPKDMKYVKDNNYVVYNKKIYDISEYLESHPGGKSVLVKNLGKDITDSFDKIFHSPRAKKILESFYLCDLEDSHGRLEDSHGRLEDSHGRINLMTVFFTFTLIIVLGYLIFYLVVKKRENN